MSKHTADNLLASLISQPADGHVHLIFNLDSPAHPLAPERAAEAEEAVWAKLTTYDVAVMCADGCWLNMDAEVEHESSFVALNVPLPACPWVLDTILAAGQECVLVVTDGGRAYYAHQGTQRPAGTWREVSAQTGAVWQGWTQIGPLVFVAD